MSPQTETYVITGHEKRTDVPYEIRLDASRIQCICETPRGVNYVRQVGADIRAQERQFWIDANQAFTNLDNYEPNSAFGL